MAERSPSSCNFLEKNCYHTYMYSIKIVQDHCIAV